MFEFNSQKSSNQSLQDDDYLQSYVIAPKAHNSAQVKSVGKATKNIKKHIVQDQPQEQTYSLKPKMRQNTQKQNLPNKSNVTVNSRSSAKFRKPLMQSYTFKLTNTSTRKKHDPVSLFQQTSQIWKRNKFLASKADNKEGRKLGLDYRNKKNIKI